jgi:hypothetical protein
MWGLRTWKKVRWIENIPTSKVRSAAMGTVELTGIARPRAIEKAPMSGTDCCWWSCDIQELRRSGKNSRWVTVGTRHSMDLFFLEDSTGQVLVNPMGAEMHVLTNTFPLNSGTRTTLGPVLNGWGFNDMNWFGGTQNLRVIESTIPDSAPLYIIGELVISKNQLGDREGRLRAHLRRIKEDPARMTAADANKDGQIDAQEWDAFRKLQEQAFAQEEAARDTANPEVTMINAPAEGLFLIATKSESEILGRFKWWAPLAMFGGLALTCLGAWLAIQARWPPALILGVSAAGLLCGGFFSKGKKSWWWF